MRAVYMRFPKGLAKCLTLSYDDCVEQDIRLVSLMKQNGIAGTFNINAANYSPEGKVFAPGTIHRRLTERAALETFSGSELIEVATHGYTHPFLDKLPCALVASEICDDRRALEKLFKKIVRGHAYPYGTYNDKVIEILRDCGIVYARTTHSTHSFKMPENWLTLHPTCHHKDPALFELLNNFLSADIKSDGIMFYLWGHTFEFESDDNWDIIEKFIDKAKNRDDIWYATNIQIYEYTKAYEALVYSADGKTVSNPTSTDVWIAEYKKEPICIPAGQCVEL